MVKITFLIVSFLFLARANSQEAVFHWAGSMGSSNLDRVQDMAVDDLGNSYITGSFENTIDFDPGDGVHELTPIAHDIYIAKYNFLGELEWCKSFGSSSLCVAYSVCANDDFVYVTGAFAETVDFDPGPGVFELDGGTNTDIFVLKLDTDGNFEWANANGDALPDAGRGITVDEINNVYVVGFYEGTVDFDPGAGVFDITSAGDRDVFIQKLNSDGDLIWVKSIGGGAEDRVWSITLDPSSNVYVGGNYEGTCDFDPGVGVYPYTSTGFFDDYIVKLNPDGDFVWAVSFGGTSGDVFVELNVDSDGNVYSTGFFSVNMDIEPGVEVTEFISSGSNDIFIQKLDTDGNFVWGKQIGAEEQERSFDMELDELNNIYTTGYFVGSTDFDPGAGAFNYTSAGSSDIFVQKLDEDGNFIWAKAIGGVSSDQGSAIAVDPENNVYLAGNYKLTVDFDPGPEEFNLEAISDADIFILKLNSCFPDATADEITSCISYTWIDGETYYEDNNSATYTLTNIDGCDSLVTLDLTINEVDITTSAVGSVITSNEAGATYQWLDCNDGYSEIGGETGVSYTPSEDGDYAVKVTIDECTDTSACVSIDGVGIYDNSLVDQISLYPNPSSGFVYIDLGDLKDVAIQIYSVSGSLVYRAINVESKVYSFELDVEAGIYFVEVQSSDGQRQFQLLTFQ